MKKWEYLHVVIGRSYRSDTTVMNEYGERGWELVSTEGDFRTRDGYLHLFFKREIECLISGSEAKEQRLGKYDD